jgi:gamma-glutamyl-gamma-aminobutyraldehyde dehydrogenase
MKIAREEIFGPVLSVITFKTEEEGLFSSTVFYKKNICLKKLTHRHPAGIALANDSEYGLAASVYSRDFSLAHRAAQALRAGTVSVNCFSEGDMTTPFGGFKQSGFGGRDKSIKAHESYCELKTIWMNLM